MSNETKPVASDRELLEAAAKAAGYVIESFTADGGCWVYEAGAPMNSDGEPPIFKWHPLADDGDALRLAVRLKLTLDLGDNASEAVSPIHWYTEQHKGDPLAATRRAIVRAAAALGGGDE